MANKLVTVALCGFGIAVVSAVVAVSLGDVGRDIRGFNGIGDNFHLPIGVGGSCGNVSADAATITRRLPWTDHSGRIELDLAANSSWSPGSGTDVVLSGPAELVNSVRIDGDEINSGCDGDDGRRLSIDLPGQAFSHYAINGLGQLHLHGLNQPALDLNIGGAALVEATGVVPRTTLDVSGAASVTLNNLLTQELDADLSGASNVIANPAETANIDISGLGQVTLLSRPRNYHADISGLGHVSVPDQPGNYE